MLVDRTGVNMHKHPCTSTVGRCAERQKAVSGAKAAFWAGQPGFYVQ